EALTASLPRLLVNAPMAESAMVLPEIKPAAPIVRLPFARAVKSPAAPPLMVPLIAIFLPATSVSELLLQFTAFETVMSPPVLVSVVAPLVVTRFCNRVSDPALSAGFPGLSRGNRRIEILDCRHRRANDPKRRSIGANAGHFQAKYLYTCL